MRVGLWRLLRGLPRRRHVSWYDWRASVLRRMGRTKLRHTRRAVSRFSANGLSRRAGGNELRTFPGYYAASASALAVSACPPPATARCVAWDSTAQRTACGEAYAGAPARATRPPCRRACCGRQAQGAHCAWKGTTPRWIARAGMPRHYSEHRPVRWLCQPATGEPARQCGCGGKESSHARMSYAALWAAAHARATKSRCSQAPSCRSPRSCWACSR